MRFAVETAELTAEQSGILMSYHGCAARVMVMPHAGGDVEIEEVKTEHGFKTPGQRLRAVVFVWWSQQPEPKVSFELWYADKMNAIIEGVKTKLDQ